MKRKVLVVEDDNTIRENVSEYLQIHNFEVLTADNGEKGYNTAIKEQPDIIISDVMMPEMSGLDMLIFLKKNPQTNLIPVVFTTAKTDVKDIRKGMTLGADDYLTKPFEFKDLLSTINAQISKKEVLNNHINKEYEKSFQHWRSIANHELFTPINVIQNIFHISDQQSKLDHELKSVFDISVTRLKRTISNLLLLSGVDQFSINEKEYTLNSLDQLIKSILSEIYTEERNIPIHKFKLKYDCDEVIRIKDFNVIAIKEMLDNAYKYSPLDSTIEIQFKHKNSNFELSVKNENKFNNQVPIQLNRPFSQVERSRNEQQGLGFGLFIINRISELYNCKFELIQDGKFVVCNWQA